ncbi:MAG TPA: hypothetical protein VEU32_03230 [Burkholderiales bacterium]|nr:hypothetical protein [Burkholderiales bacterium]
MLLQGVDTVECAYYLRARAGRGIDFERLAVEKEMLRQSKGKDPKLVRLGELEFLLQRYGSSSGYPLVFDNADMSIQCGEYNSPSFFVTYRSEALWRDGTARLHERFLDWAHAIGFEQVKLETLSRVDFAFDYHLPAVDFDEESFVSLSAADSKHRRDRKLRGVAFGQSDVRLRVYDKVAEIGEKSLKVWFFDLWGEKEDVWRIEWQVRKELMRRFGIRTVGDLIEGQGDVLRYLAAEHDTLRVPSSDPNRSRWPLHPLWIDLQRQIAELPAQGVYREIDPQATLRERLMRLAISIHGSLKQVAALHSVELGAGEIASKGEALERLEALIGKVHDPFTWQQDVQKRMDQIRLGAW